MSTRSLPTSWLRRCVAMGTVVGIACGLGAGLLGAGPLPPAPATDSYVVVGYNDLGMHCMQNDFSQMMILPPFNTVRAQVIRRGGSPDIMNGSDIQIGYSLPANTHSSDKCNFWESSQQLLGAAIPPDTGVTGSRMSGVMAYDSARRDFFIQGMPVTPIDDNGIENPYSLAELVAKAQGVTVGTTQTVVPVSWEMSCNLCHNTPGISTATDILRAHDRLHNTQLETHQPVTCASCHSDNALGAAGQPGVSSMSSAMHTAHAPRMGQLNIENSCYACHPGIRTNCQRDVHAARGVTCTSCHGDMAAVGNPSRNPWVTEPKCSDCHTRAGFQFEETGKLYRDSKGHMGVMCYTCHGSPHTIGPATTETDNLQSNRLQGHPGVVNDCRVCHITTPSDPFPHRRNN